MKNYLFILLFLLTYGICTAKDLNPNKPVYVEIATTMGKVTVKLYDDTPLHRDNFIKLCQSGEYKDMDDQRWYGRISRLDEVHQQA